jgi:hypothetical protein
VIRKGELIMLLDDTTGQEPAIDNQNDLTSIETSESTQEKPDAGTETTEGEETIVETEGKSADPEFKDENMQARFTQRMTEFKQKENEFNERLSNSETKAKAFDNLTKMDKFLVWYNKELRGQKEEEFEISDQEYNQIMIDQDPTKLKEIINRGVQIGTKKALGSKMNEIEREVLSIKQTRSIDDFANEHKDFWELDDQGKIEPYLLKFANANMSMEEKLSLAHRLAKSENLDKQIAEKAYNHAEDKKKLSTDKGRSSDSVISKNTKPKNWKDTFNDFWKEKGWAD